MNVYIAPSVFHRRLCSSRSCVCVRDTQFKDASACRVHIILDIRIQRHILTRSCIILICVGISRSLSLSLFRSVSLSPIILYDVCAFRMLMASMCDCV